MSSSSRNVRTALVILLPSYLLINTMIDFLIVDSLIYSSSIMIAYRLDHLFSSNRNKHLTKTFIHNFLLV
jgi:hypothetical protein